MRPFSKGFAFIPLLIVFFLLVVSAVTSYVVINQGTGGYSSRAAGSCQYNLCSAMVDSRGYCTTAAVNAGHCITVLKSPGVYGCSPKNEFMQSNNGIAYFSCPSGATCSKNEQCSSGLSCSNGTCQTPKCSNVGSGATCGNNVYGCSSFVTCSSGLDCYKGSNTAATCMSPATVCSKLSSTSSQYKACCQRTEGQTCGSDVSECAEATARAGVCGTGLTCTGGKCVKVNTAPVNSSSCLVGSGFQCNQRALATLHCPDGVIDCKSPNVCLDSNNKSVSGTTRTGTCKPRATDPKPTSTPTPADPKPTVTPVSGGGGSGGGGGGGGVVQDPACVAIGGVCTDVGSAQQCTDPTKPVLVTGKCPSGGTNIRCCVPSSGGGGGTVTPSPVTGTTGDVTLNFTLRLQGVTAQPRGGQTVPFKVKLKGPSVKDYVSGTLTANSAGKWSGSVAFTGISVGASTKYTVYIKVGKHLQKRVCAFAPTEASGGLYNCTDSAIPLTAGVNNLDFSGIMLLAGDLPSSTGEQNGVVDSYDISYILNNLGATDATKMAIGDLNFDGVIDTQDRSLIIQSLNVKYDDQ